MEYNLIYDNIDYREMERDDDKQSKSRLIMKYLKDKNTIVCLNN